MARGELLRKLFKGYRMKDSDEFEKVALEIIAEEKQKNNNQLSKDLMRILDGTNGSKAASHAEWNVASFPQDRERHMSLVEVRNPDAIMSDIILDSKRTHTIQKIMEEYKKAELIKMHRLEPNRKILFCGPPGCGKTLCAEIISRELGLPLLYTRFDSVVSSLLGETAANLRKIFDYATSGQWVVMFDEFDAIGKARDDQNEHGELKRVVNSFLQILDSFKSNSLIIAATNHEQLLDPALWRRFDEVVHFPKPTQKQLVDLLTLKLSNFQHSLNTKSEATKLNGMSFADVERICHDSIKTAIVNNKDSVGSSGFGSAVERHKVRLQIARSAYRKKTNI